MVSLMHGVEFREMAQENLRIFVSYSRADTAFADEIVAGLEFNGGFEVTIDRQSIEKGEDWKARLGALIESADTIVFVLSPASAQSKICRWEVEEASRLAKRILPVLHSPLGDVQAPPALAAINYLDFTQTTTLIAGIRELAAALQTDLVWLREGTRLLNLALDWERAGRRENRLLVGEDIVEAKAWLANRPSTESLTELHRNYIKASEKAEVARNDEERIRLAELAEAQRLSASSARKTARRTLAGLLVAIALALTAAVLGYWAVKQRDLSEHVTKEAQFTQSGLLSKAANGLFDSDLGRDVGTAVALALNGLSDDHIIDRHHLNFPRDTQAVLYSALNSLNEKNILHDDANAVDTARFSPNGKMIFTTSGDNDLRIWDAETGAQIAKLQGHKAEITSAAFSPDGSHIATASYDQTARIWNIETGQQAFVLSGQKDQISSVKFSLDGKRVLTSAKDGSARIWDASTGKQIAIIEGETPSSSMFFSNDGSIVASIFQHDNFGQLNSRSNDQISPNLDNMFRIPSTFNYTVRFWDALTGQQTTSFKVTGAEDVPDSLVFSPDGSKIVMLYTVSEWIQEKKGTAIIWQVATGKQIARLDGHTKGINSVAFSPSGDLVVTTSDDNSARIWAVDTGKQVALLNGHTDKINSADFSPDGLDVVTASQDRTARLWHATTGRLRRIFSGHSRGVSRAYFSPDGSQIATTSGDHTVRIWTVPVGARFNVQRRHTNWVTTALFSPSSTFAVTPSRIDNASLWDVRTGQQVRIFKDRNIEGSFGSFSPDGSQIITSSHYRTASVWDTATGKRQFSLERLSDDFEAAIFSPNGDRILTYASDLSMSLNPGVYTHRISSEDQIARLFDAKTGSQIAVLQGHSDRIVSAVFSRDGDHVATASEDGTARIWEGKTGKQIAVLRGHSGHVKSVVFDPSGARILTTSEDRTAVIWQANSAKQIAILRGHTSGITSGDFSPDGTKVITGSYDSTARLWDTLNGNQIDVFKGHSGSILSATFSPDGTQILTASWDKTARLWDIATGKAIAILDGHSEGGTRAAFSPDGKWILTASLDGQARIWRNFLDIYKLIDEAKKRAPRCLTPEQRVKYFLPSSPPRWCITGSGREHEKDPTKWRPKYPYDTEQWKQWLRFKDSGSNQPLPSSK